MENKENLDLNQRPPQNPQIPEDQQQQFFYPGFPTPPGGGRYPWDGAGRYPWYDFGRYPWYDFGRNPWDNYGRQPWRRDRRYPWHQYGRQPWDGSGQFPWYGGGSQPWYGGGRYPWATPYTQDAEGLDYDSPDSPDYDAVYDDEANTEQFWFGYPGLGYPGFGLYPGLGFGYPGFGIYPGIGFGYPWRYYHRPYWRRRWW